MRKQPARGTSKLLRRRAWGPVLTGLLALTSVMPLASQTLPPSPVSPSAAPVVLPPASSQLAAPDTTRRAVPVTAEPAEPSPEVTRRSAARIAGVIVFVTLITLLLYNVRSR